MYKNVKIRVGITSTRFMNVSISVKKGFNQSNRIQRSNTASNHSVLTSSLKSASRTDLLSPEDLKELAKQIQKRKRSKKYRDSKRQHTGEEPKGRYIENSLYDEWLSYIKELGVRTSALSTTNRSIHTSLQVSEN